MARKSSPRLHLRRLAREYTLQLLYQWDLSKEPLNAELVESFWRQAEEMNDVMKAREWRKTQPDVEATVQQIVSLQVELDAQIERVATNWRIARMAVVDRNILRLALFEMLYQPGTPRSIVMNEAVGLAKAFAGEESSRFINGLVDAFNRAIPVGAEPSQDNEKKES